MERRNTPPNPKTWNGERRERETETETETERERERDRERETLFKHGTSINTKLL